MARLTQRLPLQRFKGDALESLASRARRCKRVAAEPLPWEKTEAIEKDFGREDADKALVHEGNDDVGARADE